MKKDKTVKIKDPKLRIVRNNLRIVIKKAVHDRQMEILDSIERFKHLMGYRDGKEPTQEEKEQSHKLSIERDKLKNALERSIIYCPECLEHQLKEILVLLLESKGISRQDIEKIINEK